MTRTGGTGPGGTRNRRLRIGRGELARTIILLAIFSATALFAEPSLGETVSALIFVLGITVIGALNGLAAALIAAAIASVLFNFFLVAPLFAFSLASGSDIAPLVVFALCALVTGILAGRLQDRARAASRSNLHLMTLLDTSRALQSALRVADVADTLARTVHSELGLHMTLYQLTDGALAAVGGPPSAPPPLAIQALDAGEAQVGGSVAYRLNGSDGPVGVLAIEVVRDGIEPEHAAALGNLAALALERAAFSEFIAERRATARTEELKTALLSSVSHDLRTPLTTISASASSLIDYREQLDGETSARLLRGIVDECERLNRYTANLLEMSRMEAGQGSADHQTLSVGDMVAMAIQRVRPRAGTRTIYRMPTIGDPLVDADATLFELVLVNVLENAIHYSDEGSQIRIEQSVDRGFCRIGIADQGRGIPQEDLQRVFDRFYRVARPEPSPRGSGLGLAIAKGFVEALGGAIEARTPGLDGRGTRITISLPLAAVST